MQLHIPTIFVATIVASLILALSIGVITRREDQDGLRPFIVGLGLVALAFLLFPLRGRIPDLLSIWIANVSVSAAYALMLCAFAQFQKKRLPSWMLFGPPVVLALAIGVVLAGGMVGLFGRVIITNAVLMFQSVLLLWILVPGIRKTPGRGQYLVIAGGVLNILSYVARVAILAGGEWQTVRDIADSGASQSVVFMSTFSFLIMATIGFVLMVKERADNENRRLAVTDPLTGCWNRLRIVECAQLEMVRRRRYGIPVAMLMMDVDFFKSVNDRHGHGVGDQLLQELSRMAQGCLREADLFGRWGGEEFIVLLPSSDAAAAAAIGERVRRVIASTTFANGLQATVSLGFAEYRPGETLENWVGRADSALYQAKRAGRNRVEPCLEPSMQCDGHVPLDMIRLVWKPEYETGYALIDDQHKEFFSQGNALLDAILRKDSHESLGKRIEVFLAYVDLHFQTEEAWLVVQGWCDSADHASHHEALAERAADLLTRHQQRQLDAAEFLNFFVNELILQHLLIEDRKFASALQMRSAAGYEPLAVSWS